MVLSIVFGLFLVVLTVYLGIFAGKWPQHRKGTLKLGINFSEFGICIAIDDTQLKLTVLIFYAIIEPRLDK